MRDIFGKHARVFDNKERLFGRFNADLETVCFACAEEMLWAGDRSASDALKSLITGDTLTLEVKNGSRWDVPNRLHMMMTTNHEHAVQAGVSDRRFFVLDVSDEKAQDVRWFDPLHKDLAEGGKEQFLQFLLKVKLAGWHPRNLPKTADTVAQQRMSADTVARWIQSCIDADSIVGHAHGLSFDLGTTVTSENLRTAYAGYCAQHRLFPMTENVFGKALTAMLGEPVRMAPATGTTRRPRAYKVLNATKLQIRLDDYIGLAKR
jgi:phage/plasmid-associated DNA primase